MPTATTRPAPIWSGLADGNLTVVASVTDAAGNPASATDDTTLLDTDATGCQHHLDGNITDGRTGRDQRGRVQAGHRRDRSSWVAT